MSDFTLDDVRESFTADMSALIGSIREASGALLGAQPLSLPVPRSPRGRSPLEEVEAHAHAIYGSSSLIAITSMSRTAQALEHLASRGHVALLELERQVGEVKAIAAKCDEAAQQLSAMLSNELEGHSEAAGAIAERLLPALGGAPAVAQSPTPQAAPAAAPPVAPTAAPTAAPTSAPPAAPPAAPSAAPTAPPVASAEPREFTFDDDPAPASEPRRDELLEVFQNEAREYLVALQGHLQALVARPNDLSVAAQAERIFHTMKGAAATVGLTEVSALAATLQTRFEALAGGVEPMTPPLLGEMVRSTNRMLRAASLPEISLGQLEATEQTAEGDNIRSFFIEEASQTCREASALIEDVSTAGADRRPELLRQVAALFHRLKGSALLLGDQPVADLSARLEQDCARGARADELRAGLTQLERSMQGAPEAAASGSSIAPSEVSGGGVAGAPERRAERVTVSDEPELWEAFTQECQELLEALDRDIFALEQSANPQRELEGLMRQTHTLKGAVNSVGMAPTGKLLHEVETVLESLVAAPQLPPVGEVARVLLAVQQEVRLNLSQARKGTVESSNATWAAWAAERFKPGSRTVKSAESTRRGAPESEAHPSSEPHLIRVTTERLDELMNLSGEMVVSRSRLVSRVATLRSLQGELGRSRRALLGRVDEFRERYEYADLDGKARRRPRAESPGASPNGPGSEWDRFSELELDRYEDVHILSRSLGEITDDLAEMDAQLARELGQIAEDSEGFGSLISRIQGEVTRARMVPVESLFARLRLPVRDAAERAGKEVVLRLEGETVNIDKTIIDALYKPLLHLVRNAVFHGVESPEERERVGKPRVGVLTLRARQDSGQVVIELSDDGKGLDLEKLKEKGVAAGLVSPDEPLGSAAVRDLVFAHGVSTSPTVSSVAGRGVGGEVVKRSIERLNGEVRSETTPGLGTTFVITLPLTLIITQALLVRSASRVLALPLFFAERIVELEHAPPAGGLALAQIKVGDQYLPLRRVEALFGEPAEVSQGPVVVLRLGDRRLAIQVDQLLAREEIVVKSLGDVLTGHPAFAGVTMRGNGELVLVLDVPGIMDGLGVRGRPDARSSVTPVPTARHDTSASTSSWSELPSATPMPPPNLLPAPSHPSAQFSRPSAQLSYLGAQLNLPGAPSSHPSAPSSRPSGQVSHPSGQVSHPSGQVSHPSGQVSHPSGQVSHSSGQVSHPSALSSRPSGQVSHPSGQVSHPSAQVSHPGAQLSAAVPRRMRVLVVDDSLSVRKVAEKVLAGLGVDVTLAVDGVDALARLRAESFDLVFTDLEMPRLHGYELIREIRFMPKLKTLPVVVVSSRSGAKHQEQARALGATDYVTKPFTAQMLDAILKRHVKLDGAQNG